MHVEEEERRLGWNQFHLGSKISNETGYRRCQYESYVELSFQKCCAMIELLHYQSGKHGFHSSRFKVRKVFFGCAWLFDWFKWPASVEYELLLRIVMKTLSRASSSIHNGWKVLISVSTIKLSKSKLRRVRLCDARCHHRDRVKQKLTSEPSTIHDGKASSLMIMIS